MYKYERNNESINDDNKLNVKKWGKEVVSYEFVK